MARRYIGNAVIDIEYHDRGTRGYYRGYVSAGEHVWHFDHLYPASAGYRPGNAGLGEGVALDSPEAYDKMAAAAVSFGSYYTTHNRKEAPKWAPSAEEADAIDEAVSGVMDDKGRYEVRRSPGGKISMRNEVGGSGPSDGRYAWAYDLDWNWKTSPEKDWAFTLLMASDGPFELVGKKTIKGVSHNVWMARDGTFYAQDPISRSAASNAHPNKMKYHCFVMISIEKPSRESAMTAAKSIASVFPRDAPDPPDVHMAGSTYFGRVNVECIGASASACLDAVRAKLSAVLGEAMVKSVKFAVLDA